MKFKFSEPYTFEDKEFKELDLDFKSLNGKAIIEIHKQLTDGNPIVLPATDWGFCCEVAARASKQPKEMLEGMPAGDFCRLMQAVQNFLLAGS